MIVLGIETSTPVTSLALGGRDGIVASVSVARGRGHVEFVAPAIRMLCEQADVRLEHLSGVAVGVGPGLFTGMRVGISTAKTLAQALSVPLVGVSSLDLLAYEVRYTPRAIWAVVDAKRNEVFAASYRAVPGGVARRTDYETFGPDALVAEVEARNEETLLVGNGVAAHRSVLEKIDRAEMGSSGTQFPRAEHLVELAIGSIEREEFVPPERLEPLYVRKSDAEIKWEERGVTIERPFRVKVPKRATGGSA